MKKYLHLLILGATLAATAFAVGSQPTSASNDCSDGSCCASCCGK